MGYVNQNILCASAVNEGFWVDASAYEIPFSILVYGFNASGDDQVQIVVSNMVTQPALVPPTIGDGTIVEGWPTINADGIYGVSHPVRWVRVRKSQAASQPSLTTASLFAQIRS